MVVVDPDRGNDGPATGRAQLAGRPDAIYPGVEQDWFLRRLRQLPKRAAQVCNPYPLSDKYFLCSRTLAGRDEMALFVVTCWQ